MTSESPGGLTLVRPRLYHRDNPSSQGQLRAIALTNSVCHSAQPVPCQGRCLNLPRLYAHFWVRPDGGASPTGGGAGGTSDNTGDSAVSAGPTLSNFLTRHFVENFEAYASSVRQLIDFDTRYTVQFEREGTYIIGGKIYTVNDNQIPHMICSTESTPGPNDPVQGRRLSLITATDNSRTHS